MDGRPPAQRTRSRPGAIPAPQLDDAAGTSGRRVTRRAPPLIAAALLVGVVVLRLTVVTPMTVDGESMEPTLRQGDVVLVRELPASRSPLAHGDLVVFEQGPAQLSVKRVVGLAGEHVAIRDGILDVDGTAIAEAYVDAATVDGLYFGPVTVPSGSVFVLGDNRDRSVDSRDIGSVALDRVVGRVVAEVRTPW